MPKIQPYTKNGIQLSKLIFSVGDKLEITYTGLLKDGGADEIYLYGGYGKDWTEKVLIPMDFDGEKFNTTINISHDGEFNFTFKDPANNWDNNSGENYKIQIKKTTTRSNAKVADNKNTTKKTTSAGKTTKKTTAKVGAAKSSATKSNTAKSASSTTKVAKRTTRSKTTKK